MYPLEPSHFILSGSSDDWIDTRRSLGLVRDTENDPVALLGCGSLKKVAKIRKILTSRDSHLISHEDDFVRLLYQAYLCDCLWLAVSHVFSSWEKKAA